jgi:hypothetical protein
MKKYLFLALNFDVSQFPQTQTHMEVFISLSCFNFEFLSDMRSFRCCSTFSDLALLPVAAAERIVNVKWNLSTDLSALTLDILER